MPLLSHPYPYRLLQCPSNALATRHQEVAAPSPAWAQLSGEAHCNDRMLLVTGSSTRIRNCCGCPCNKRTCHRERPSVYCCRDALPSNTARNLSSILCSVFHGMRVQAKNAELYFESQAPVTLRCQLGGCPPCTLDSTARHLYSQRFTKPIGGTDATCFDDTMI